MALTQISTDGVKDDAVTAGKIPANAVGSSELADNAVDTNSIANNAVTAAKLASGVQTTINNNADNRVITGSGTANTLEGEANLTFDGGNLVSKGDNGITIEATTNNTAGLFTVIGKNNSGHVSAITRIHSIPESSSNAATTTTFSNRNSSNAVNEHMRIDSSGKVKIATTDGSPHANADELTLGDPSGTVRSGMTFNAGANKDSSIHFGDPDSNSSGQINYDHNTDALSFYTDNTKRIRIDSDGLKFGVSTSSHDALDDYEEGTFTPNLIYQNSSGLTLATNSAAGKYTKIGRVVYILGYINWNVSGSPVNDNLAFGGLPFSTATGAITAGDTRFIGNITLRNTNAQSVTHQIQPYGNNSVLIIVENEQGNRANELGSGNGFQARFQFWYHAS